MPQSWSAKRERQYEHVKDSAEDRGASTKRAKEIAARTVNKHRKEEGRTKDDWFLVDVNAHYSQNGPSTA